MLKAAGVLAAALVMVTAVPAHADRVRDEQKWVLQALNAEAAWRTSLGEGVTVAVLDSGVDPTVPELAGKVIEGPDMTRTTTSRGEPGWGLHGTAMASLIAGHGRGPSDGIIGVAPRAKILSVRVLLDQEDPEYREYRRSAAHEQSLATGLREAVERGAKVINMSLGGYGVRPAERQAIAYALSRGVVLVAATGNDGDSEPARRAGHSFWSFPAGYPGVIGVGAVDRNGTPAVFSNDNLSVSVAAPGVKIASAEPRGRYISGSGTSPASALVAGVAALIKAKYPDMRPELVASAITGSTRSRPTKGWDDKVGFGVVDASAALARAASLNGYRAEISEPPSRYFGGGPPSDLPGTPGVDRFRLWLYGGAALTGVALFIVAIIALRRRVDQRPGPH